MADLRKHRDHLPVYGRTWTPASKELTKLSRGDASTKAAAVFFVWAAIVLALVIWIKGTDAGMTMFARVISPFDHRPTMTFAELIEGPDAAVKKKAELCAWAVREELRNPGPFTKATRAGVCQ